MPAFDLHPACANVEIVDAAAGKVVTRPRRRKVAIVGFATNTLHLVPWFDPEYELWGLNQGYINFHRRADRWFEMHQPEFTEDAREPEYVEWLKACPVPIYMIEPRPEITNSVRFPIEAAIQLGGRDYFTSSISYMIAAAIMDGFEEIGIYGINLAIGGEYFHQKANAEWWIGQAEGRGLRVYVPAASSLLKQHARYGYSIEPEPNALTIALLKSRIAAYRDRCESLMRDHSVQLGAMRESEALLQIVEGVTHGADVVTQFQPPQ